MLGFFENLDYMMMGPDDVYLANILKIIHLQSAKQAPKDTVCLPRICLPPQDTGSPCGPPVCSVLRVKFIWISSEIFYFFPALN